MASTIKHNKKRNTGLVYEFLVRRMALQLLEGDKQGYIKSLDIAKKYFSAGTPLAQERELFEVIRGNRGVSGQVAQKILDEVRRAAKRLDPKKLEIKKSSLIKDLNRAFGKGFYSDHRVPEYRLLASIQVLIDSCSRAGQIAESVGIITLEALLVQFMTTVEPAKVRVGTEDKVDRLVCALAAKKFNESYGKALNVDQNKLLERYMRATMSDDRVSLGRYLSAEQAKISAIIQKSRDASEVREDPVMLERMDEACKNLAQLDCSSGSDDAVQEIMLYSRLVEELCSNE